LIQHEAILIQYVTVSPSSSTNGLIEQITITNPPVQVFSINGCTNTEFAYITIDGSAGDSLGKNTDAFDIGSSTGITIGMFYSHILLFSPSTLTLFHY